MNEFIVWDDNIKEFNSFSDDYSISQKGTISWQGRDGLEIEE